MLQLKLRERQGEQGGDGCCSKPCHGGVGEEPVDPGSWSPPSSASAGHVQVGSIIPHPAPASPSSGSAPRCHVSHRTLPAKSFGDGPTPSSPWPSWCPGVPLRAHPPILSSLPGSFLQSLATRVGREKREHQHHGGTMEGPAHADPPSHGKEHPDPSPKQLHIPPRALRKRGER